MAFSRSHAPLESVVPFRLGGHVALDFVNTVSSWTEPPARDYLGSYDDLIRWAYQGGLVELDGVERLLAEPPQTARAAHGEALQLRARLERLFGGIIAGRIPGAADLDALNAILKEARSRQAFLEKRGRFEWVWTSPAEARTPVMLVALAAAELLERHDLSRLKRCPAPDGCGWMFLDQSRNRSRKWCSMELCGSAAKSRRYALAHPS